MFFHLVGVLNLSASAVWNFVAFSMPGQDICAGLIFGCKVSAVHGDILIIILDSLQLEPLLSATCPTLRLFTFRSRPTSAARGSRRWPRSLPLQRFFVILHEQFNISDRLILPLNRFFDVEWCALILFIFFWWGPHRFFLWKTGHLSLGRAVLAFKLPELMLQIKGLVPKFIPWHLKLLNLILFIFDNLFQINVHFFHLF